MFIKKWVWEPWMLLMGEWPSSGSHGSRDHWIRVLFYLLQLNFNANIFILNDASFHVCKIHKRIDHGMCCLLIVLPIQAWISVEAILYCASGEILFCNTMYSTQHKVVLIDIPIWLHGYWISQYQIRPEAATMTYWSQWDLRLRSRNVVCAAFLLFIVYQNNLLTVIQLFLLLLF